MTIAHDSTTPVPFYQARWGRYLLVFGLPLLALCALILYRRANLSQAQEHARAHRGNAANFQQWAKETVALWNRKEYAPLRDREALRNSLPRVPIEGAPLAPLQRASLYDALLLFLSTYSDGGLDNWKTLRFTEDNLPHEMTGRGKWQLQLYYGSYAALNKRTIPDLLPRDQEIRTNWIDRYMTGSQPDRSVDADQLFNGFLQGITCGQYYSNYFAGLSSRDVLLRHTECSSDPQPLPFYPFFPFRVQKGYAQDATFPNEGYWEWQNGSDTHAYFIVHPTLHELLAQYQRVDCVNVFMYVKINDPGEVTPLLLRYVWNPGINRWMLDSMVDGNVFGGRRVLLFM